MRISDWSSDVCSSDLERQGQRGLSDPRSADEKRVGSPLQATAEQFVDLGIAARRKLSLEFGVMLGSDEARENPEPAFGDDRSEEHTSELQSLVRNSYAVFCLKKKNTSLPKKKEQIDLH